MHRPRRVLPSSHTYQSVKSVVATWPRAIGLLEQGDPLSQEFRNWHRKTGLYSVVALLLTGMFSHVAVKQRKLVVSTESWKLKERLWTLAVQISVVTLWSTCLNFPYILWDSLLNFQCFPLTPSPFGFCSSITKWSLINLQHYFIISEVMVWVLTSAGPPVLNTSFSVISDCSGFPSKCYVLDPWLYCFFYSKHLFILSSQRSLSLFYCF